MNNVYKYLLVMALLLSGTAYAQLANPVIYRYDAAGNRTLRETPEIEFEEEPPPPEEEEEESEEAEEETAGALLSTSRVATAKSSRPYTEDINGLKLRLYPNPAVSSVTVELDQEPQDASRSSLTLYSSTGLQLLTQPYLNKVNTVDVSRLAPGMYVMQLRVDGKTIPFKLIKRSK
jgi:hypothetical protein